MTPHLDDETLSAVLDGTEAPPGGHLDTCADCRHRLDALRRAAAAVAAPPPPVPDALRDRHITAALAALPPGAAAGGTAGAATVAVRRARRPWQRVAIGLAAAAAAAGLVLPLSRLGGDGSDVASNKAAREAAGPTAAAAGAALDLGAVDEASLPAALAARLAHPATGAGGTATEALPTPPDPVAQRCEASLRASTPGLAQLLLAATATWKGTPAVVLAFGPGPRSVVAYVTDAERCEILHFVRLP